MDTANSSLTNTGSSTSSTDSDNNSVVSAIFNQNASQHPDVENIFAYLNVPRPLSAGSYAIASFVYVLIDEGRSMSADMRLMWYLKRLGTIETVDEDLSHDSPEQCKVMSFIPKEEIVDQNDTENLIFVMDSFTRVFFLTAVYNMVYCLDMSPSNCSVDIQRGHVMLDEMIVALSRSIEGFIRPFIVPGSNRLIFEPQVYVTVIVHTPFYTSLAQQVLVQGWLINNRNFYQFINTVTSEMNRLENALAKTKIVIEEPQSFDYDSTPSNEDACKIHKIDGREISSDNNSINNNTSSKNRQNNLINSNENMSSVGNNNPDSGFINTLRYGMLAVRLLPQSSISNLIVITDGMITLADIQVLDSVLNQLRCIGVACSFLHVSSQFHPHSSHGHVPYSELMQFIATATSGTYLNSFPKTTPNLLVNFYHDKFIMWSFKRGDGNESSSNTANLSCTPPRVRLGEWTVRNSNFYGNRQTQLVSKKQITDNIQAHLENIVCCRMREGFIVEDIQFKDAGNNEIVLNINNSSKLHIKFILPWTNHIYIEYELIVKWPPSIKSTTEPAIVQEIPKVQVPLDSTIQSKQQKPSPSQPDGCLNIHYTVVVKGPYEFLHDITCGRNKKSQPRYQFSRQQCQFQLSSCRSSSISITAATTTITKNSNIMPDSSINPPRILTSKYRQALIARFWLTMRSIVQTDMLIKHLETYSPSTGHLSEINDSNQSIQTNDNLELKQTQKLESQQTPSIQPTDDSILIPSSPKIHSNLNNIIVKSDKTLSTVTSDVKSVNITITGVPNRSPLRNGMSLFYHSSTNSNTSFSLKQNSVKSSDKQQSNTGHQHQQFADFWKPVCTLDPDSQWPKWFSTYRLGDGVLLLRHDRLLPQWLHMKNTSNDEFQTVTCKEAAEALFALMKQWCTFVLIDNYSYVKCLNKSETHTGNVSFCVAIISPRTPSCCGVVLHLAFQSCVPVSVHHKIIDDLKMRIQLLDSITAVNLLSSIEEKQLLTSEKNKNLKEKVNKVLLKKKKLKPRKYVYLLDKPLEKILIRYERIPSQYTTVIFPDGSQPCTAVTTTKYKNSKHKSRNKHQPNDSQDSSTKIASRNVTTTTTLSRYLYHRRWIWGSGYSPYNKYSASESQKLQLQLERTISMLTKIRLREGFRFAHSSAGIINMVLQVDMIEGSSSCPSTPTSHCVIQYVLFPPNFLHKQLQKNHDYTSIVDMLKKKNNDARSSSSSIEEQQFGDGYNCCTQQNIEDDYQLIMECWIEPQHGSVVVNKKQNNKYMSGLMYEELPDAIWQVDSNCINSLFTFQQMQYLCTGPNNSTDTDIDLDKRHGLNKTDIIDAGRIYKMPFTFSLVHFLPKCKHYSSLTFSLFTKCDTDTETDFNSVRNQQILNNMLEHSFYSRLRAINHQLFDVNNSNTSIDHTISRMNDQEIGQCFIKRVDDSRLILTVAPSYTEDKCNIMNNSSEDSLQPIGRSRANTWHHTKRSIGNSISLCEQENYYRTMSVGSKPYYNSTNNICNNMPWTQNKLERSLCTSETKSTCNFGLNDVDSFLQDLPTHMNIDVYDCRQNDLENILISNSQLSDHTIINNYTVDSNSCSSATTESEEEESLYISSRKKNLFDENDDPLLLEKYLHRIEVIYDRSLVTTVFHALHLGFNVPFMDIQHAVDRCQHRLISFEITDYIKVVCAHFKNANTSANICSADNQTLKNHHNMIQATFASALEKHKLKSISSHPDYYFYDLADKLNYDDDAQNIYNMSKLSTSDIRQNMGGNTYKTNFNTYEMDEQDLFPLFIHLVCTVKSKTMTKSQCVRLIPTCIFEFINQESHNKLIESTDLKDLKVSIDVYCFMLPNYNDDDDDDDDRFNETNNLEKPHFPISNTKIEPLKQSKNFEDPFIYLSSSLPLKYAQGLAAFITEAEWCVNNEMAAGLLEIPIVTPDTLEKVTEHVSKSPNSSLNEHLQIPVHFVVSSSSPKYNSTSLFLKKLYEIDIVFDHGNGDELYILEKSTNDTFYILKKNTQFSADSTVSEGTNIKGTDTRCSTNEKSFTLLLPNFWVILKIQENQQTSQKENKSDSTVNTLIINMYFHCRFAELNIQKKYSAIKEVIKQNVRQVATIVNQSILLYRLHDTRTCDSLLEPIIEDHVHSDDDENVNGEMENITNHFTLGQFRCPVVWSTRFALHPRLQHSTSMLLLGVQVLHNVLDKLSVKNRRNMFVYKESSGSVFYLRVYENSSQQNQKNNMAETYDSDDDDSISRCSSATSTTATISSSIFPSSSNFSRKYSEDLNFMDSRSIQTPGSRSLGGYWGDTDSRDVEDLTLKVHGISPVGTEIRIDLVEVLQNRLNDAVLEVLTTMLYRNPQCRLYPDDVRYVQPIDGRADFTLKLALPVETKVTKLFAHNLKRNAAALLLYPPKYASRHHRFQYDVLDNSEKPIIRSFFLYNQPSGGTTGPIRGIGVSGNRGLACVLYEIYSNEENNVVEKVDNYFTDPELFKRRIKITSIEDDLKSITDYSGFVKIFVWCRGRVNMEALHSKLTSIVTNSLWDIYMEQFLKEQPIIIDQPPETHVNPLCIKYLAKWIAFGAQSSVSLSHYSQIHCRIHINHILREFKTNLSWFGISTSINSPISVRYFYVPQIPYDNFNEDCINNILSSSVDPLQLKQQDILTSDLKFYEWQIPDANPNLVICPPAAACVLIIVSVTSKIKTKQKRKQQNRKIEIDLSDSDTDNGLFVPDDEENINSDEGDNTSFIGNNQCINLVPLNNIINDSMKYNIVTDRKKYQKQQNIDTNKVTKLLLLAVSGESVHILSYNCHNNSDHIIAINRLSRWLEWRSNIITSSTYNMLGLKSSQFFNTENLPKNNNQDLLLDYKSYVTTVGEYESCNTVTVGKNSRPNSHTKLIDHDTDDKKNKSLRFNKDSHDSFIEQMVKNTKQQRRTELYQKLLFDMWIQGDASLSKEGLRLFYHHSRLLHYCLTPLLFLPRWRFESAATRDHLMNSLKKKKKKPSPSSSSSPSSSPTPPPSPSPSSSSSSSSSPSPSPLPSLPPLWHKRLCTRLSNAYTHYIQTNPFFSGFQLVQISKSSRVSNDSVSMELDTKPTTVYFKKSLPGVKGGLIIIETGISQPFYYLKFSCVERARLTNQVENYEDKYKPPYSVLDLCETIKRHMHLHSFTYDFHVRVLSERLSILVQKEKTGKRNNYGHNLSMLLENKNIIQDNANPPEKKKKKKKNAIARFLDDYLKYYKLPPLYSSCLVLAGSIKRSKIPVTGLQLYKYLLDNCSIDCDGMAVLKICDSALADGENGATLFDDDDDEYDDNNDDVENVYEKNIYKINSSFKESQNSTICNDLTDFIFVHHMAGSDIQRRQELEINPTYTDNQYEVCGLYDATLIMTLSSVRKLLLNSNNAITLSYYVLLTNNENLNSEKKDTQSFKTINNNNNKQQRHSTPIRLSNHRFGQSNNLLSASVPSSSFGNNMMFRSATCWGSLDENNTTNTWSQTLPNNKNKFRRYYDHLNDNSNTHQQQMIKKTKLIKFYEKKAAELVAHTVDTAANQCRVHLLWQKFEAHCDQRKPGAVTLTIDELEELLNKSPVMKPLSKHENSISSLVIEVCKGPQWFLSLFKLISAQSSIQPTTALSIRCRIYNCYNSDRQYLVVLPHHTDNTEITTFIMIDNGIDKLPNIVRRSNSLINIIFRRNVNNPEEINLLVETVVKCMCFYVWRTIVSANASLTIDNRSSSVC